MIIIDNNIKQVFFIEGIEHIKNDYEVIDILLNSGIKKICVSTPNEPEGTKTIGFHINPFTPTKFDKLEERYDLEKLPYCKFIESEPLTEENYLDMLFTDNSQKGLNYLFIIKGFKN